MQGPEKSFEAGSNANARLRDVADSSTADLSYSSESRSDDVLQTAAMRSGFFSAAARWSASGSSGLSGPWLFARDLCLVGLVAATVFFTNLGGAKLWDRDEPRNAGCALEMLQRNDWVTPMFNGELRGQKPILTYWLIMSATAVFGPGEWSARFWSALLGVGTVVVTYTWVSHLFFASLARWAALILSTTLMFTVASRAATPDAPLIFLSTSSLALYIVLTFRRIATIDDIEVNPWAELQRHSLASRLRHPGRWFPQGWGAIAIYSVMSLGVLAKGPVAVVLPTIIIGLFILIQRAEFEALRVRQQADTSSRGRGQWLGAVVAIASPARFFSTVWRMQPWWIAVTVAVIAAPWFIWVGARTDGEFLNLFFFREHLERATTAMEGHRGGPWFYPVAIVIGVFPWSILVVPTALALWRLRQQTDLKSEVIGRDSSGSQQNAEKHNRDSEASVDLADRPVNPSWSVWAFPLVWVGLQITVFSLASTKLPSYVTPCYSALAALLAILPTRLEQGRYDLKGIWMRAGFATWLLVGGVLVVGLHWTLTSYLQWPISWVPAIGGALIFPGLLAWYFWEQQETKRVAVTLLVGAWLFIFPTFAAVTDYVSGFRTIDDLWQTVQENRADRVLLVGYRDLESTWVYYAGQPIFELDPDGASGATTTVASSSSVVDPADKDPIARDAEWQVKPRISPADLVRHYPDSFIVTPEPYVQELLSKLPANYRALDRRPDFLGKHQIVLIGRLPEERVAKRLETTDTQTR
jgi:4-amino-4-deoxy-L-arabinose transferase-like glycosyltransferase